MTLAGIAKERGRLLAALLGAALAACGGGGGSSGPTQPKPSVTLSAQSASVLVGNSGNLTWSSTSATSCIGGGGWTGDQGISGSKPTAPLSATTTFTLACSGPGGTANASVTITTLDHLVPAAPQAVQAAVGDGRITVTWQSLVGSYFQGNLVSSNVYVSTHPHIDVTSFVESADNQVVRGLAAMGPIVVGNLMNGAPVYVVATDVAGGFESPASVEITVTPKTIPALVEHIAALNDTGVDGCADADNEGRPCPAAAGPGQDGDVGRDADARAGALAKVGFGRAGFDFTKIDASGAALPDDATTWACVRDNVTGLIWEVPGNSPQAPTNDTYSWYESDERVNGGFAGSQNGGVCGLSSCNTKAFVASLNTASLCGFSDWRLPTRRELVSIVDLSLQGPAIDPAVFPNMSPWFNAFYWTSTVSAGTASVGVMAWSVDVTTGELLLNRKVQVDPFLSPGAVMAVRAATTP